MGTDGQKLTREARLLLEQARSAQGGFMVNLLDAAYRARGQSLPAEVRTAAAAGGFPLAEVTDAGFVRLHGSPEQAEKALLAAARRLAGGDRPLEPADLLEAALRTDDRLVRLSPDASAARGKHARCAVIEGAAWDLTAEAPSNVAGRHGEVGALLVRLARWEHPAAVVVGPPRSGRRALLLRLAESLAGCKEGPQPPPSLAGARLVELDLDMIPRARGGSARLGELVDHAREKGDILALMGGDPHWILTQVSRDCRERTRFIIPMTPQEYQRSLEQPGGGFGYLGAPVRVEEPTVEEALEMVLARLQELEAHHGRAVDDGVARTAVAWASEQSLTLPAAAVEVLDETLATCTSPAVGIEHLLETLARSGRSARAVVDRWYFSTHWAWPQSAARGRVCPPPEPPATAGDET